MGVQLLKTRFPTNQCPTLSLFSGNSRNCVPRPILGSQALLPGLWATEGSRSRRTGTSCHTAQVVRTNRQLSGPLGQRDPVAVPRRGKGNTGYHGQPADFTKGHSEEYVHNKKPIFRSNFRRSDHQLVNYWSNPKPLAPSFPLNVGNASPNDAVTPKPQGSCAVGRKWAIPGGQESMGPQGQPDFG